MFLRSWGIPLIDAQLSASFFIAYVVTSGWTSTASELFRVVPFLFSLISKTFSNSTDSEPPSFPYHQDTLKILFFCLLGITYFFLSPLILPFLLVCFSLAYIIYRNQIINVYAPKYETGGKFWPIVHNNLNSSTDVALAFKCLQTLIKKGREDHNNATMAQFLENLSSAYQDPALLPVNYAAKPNSDSTPLISAADARY